MKLYIAASSAEPERVAIALERATAAGLQITCTWPTVVAATSGGANPANASRESRFGWSSQDLTEVAAADVLWFLVPSGATTRGAWVEAGFAYASGKLLVFSGENTHQTVFCALGEEFTTDGEALAWIARVAKDRRALREASPNPALAGLAEMVANTELGQ